MNISASLALSRWSRSLLRLYSQVRVGVRVLVLAALLTPLAMLPPQSAQGQAVPTISTKGEHAKTPGGPPNSPQSAAWTALPNNGLNGNVSAFAVCGGHLYVGGLFQSTFDGVVTNLNNIARLNTTTHTWSALANTGLSANVFSLACHGNDLYVGGSFLQTADGVVTNLNKIAKYDTNNNTWSALPHHGLSVSVSDVVNALAFMGSDLYLGGYFNQTADGAVTNLNYIAKFSTTGQTWSALPHQGLGFGVNALAVSGNDLYVGGFFANTFDGGVLNLHAIAKLSGGIWSALPNHGLNGEVVSLAFNGADLYVGGAFPATQDGAVTNLNNIAKLSGGLWSALANHGLNGGVDSLAFYGGDLYVGGTDFTKTFDNAVINLNHIALFSTGSNTWSALPRGGLNGQVHAMMFIGGDLYVGGLFSESATDAPAKPGAPSQVVLNNIAVFSAAAACLSVTGNVSLQQILCTDGAGTMTVSATAAQFNDGDVSLNVSEIVSCGAETITSVRVLTPDGTNPPLNGPIGATAGTFGASVPLHGNTGALDLQVTCSGSPTPITTLILTITSVVLPPSGSVGFGTLAVSIPNSNPHIAQVVLYYKDPTLGDVIWNANAYNQLNPQFTTSGASGQFGWSVPGGQYYVKVSGPCYQTVQSSVATVPPAITNLNVTLTPVAGCRNLYLPLVTK